MSPTESATKQKIVRDIVNHVLESVIPEPALRRCIQVDQDTLVVDGRKYDLNVFKKIILVGGGKAGRRTAAELAEILGDRIASGYINVYQDQANEPVSDKIKLFPADHPTPNQAGVDGANLMIESLKNTDSSTLVIALISGGGSALMATPMEVINLQDYKDICDLLLTVPATIDEINSVRKHIDPLKGGGMRKIAENAGGFISLVLSDVPVTKTGVVDDPSVIASGPTVGDESTFEMAKNVLVGHGIWDQTPESVKSYFEENLGKEENETLRKDSPLLAPGKSQYVMVANNDLAMEAAGEKAAEYGYKAHLIGCNTGLTKDKIKAEVTEEIDIIWNVIKQHLQEGDEVTFSSFSTDGVDGHSDLAGALADMDTLKLAKEKGIDHKPFLANFDSASFFKKLGLDIETGPTGTNVADVCLALITNPNDPGRKVAVILGGEATVNISLPEGSKPGFGGRNTHLALMAAELLEQLNN